MHSVQRGVITELEHIAAIFIADWTIVLGKIASWLQLTFRNVHINMDWTLFFQNIRLGRKVSFRDLYNTLGFQSGLFFTTMRLRTQFSATLS